MPVMENSATLQTSSWKNHSARFTSISRPSLRSPSYSLRRCSSAGFQPGPQMAVYYATKAYVMSFSEALADEVKDKGVTVTCLCPGATLTGFQYRAEMTETVLFRTMRP